MPYPFRMQIRLATVILLMSVCAVALAWWGKWRRAMEEERLALAAIRDKVRGCVFFREQWDADVRWPRSLRAEPQRNVADYLLARNALVRVTAVSFDCNCREDFAKADPFRPWYMLSEPLPQESFDALENFPNLTWLEFGETVTDEQLQSLPPLPTLQTLSLSSSRNVTARGLEGLARFPRLRSLDLSYARLSDDDLSGLSSLVALEQLELDGVPIGNEGLPHLYNLKRLRRLNLERTQVTRIGVYRLRKQLPELRVLPPFNEDE